MAGCGIGDKNRGWLGLSHTDIDVLVAHPKGFPDPKGVIPRIPSWKT